MIIDFHTHIFPPQVKNNRQRYVDSDPCFAVLYENPKAKLTTVEELIAGMDASGVDISVVQNIGWTTHETVCRDQRLHTRSDTQVPL
jgi:hypothetical protein